MNKVTLPLHKIDQTYIKQFVDKKGTHLWLGPRFYGLELLAASMSESMTSKDKILIVSPTKEGSITIEQARQIKSFTRLRSHSDQDTRVVLIEHADLLTLEAQNALLKTLEEPPNDVCILLTANYKTNLLPTILSRCSMHMFRDVPRLEIQRYCTDRGLKFNEKNYLLSQGKPWLFVDLTINTESAYLSELDKAKEFLASSKVQRLKTIDRLSKDRQLSINFVTSLMDTVRLAIDSSIHNTNAVKKWTAIYRQTGKALDYINANCSVKLVLDNLALNI